MRDGVLYFNAGGRHAIHLIVSLASLRKHWDGPVAVVTEQDGPGRLVAEACAMDGRLGMIQVIPSDEVQGGGSGKAYHSKTKLPQLTPFDRTVFLDADTLVVKPFPELWPTAGGAVITKFSDWVSTGGKMSQRIKAWREVEPTRVKRQLSRAWPAINTGVLAWCGDGGLWAKDWTETGARRICFIGDETAMQLIFPDHNVRVEDYIFNASPVFDACPLRDKYPWTWDEEHGVAVRSPHVRVWHGHGFKFWKRPGGWALYRQSYLDALDANYAGIREHAVSEKFLKLLPEQDQRSIRGATLGAAA